VIPLEATFEPNGICFSAARFARPSANLVAKSVSMVLPRDDVDVGDSGDDVDGGGGDDDVDVGDAVLGGGGALPLGAAERGTGGAFDISICNKTK
jgi:hypothetical protein